MALTINTNVSAMIAQRNLGVSSAKSASSLSKLASGTRVPSAKDDAASLAVGSGIRGDVAALRQAQLNTQQGAALLQVADGAFSQITDVLVRMKSLAAQSQSDQISDTERGFLNTEYTQLLGEIDRLAATTEFNGTLLLGGSTTVVLDTANLGANINSAAGFVGFDFDSGAINATEDVYVFYDDSSGNLTLTNGTTGEAQTINLGANAATIVAAGNTRTLNFSEIGVSLTINDQFNGGNAVGAGADIGTLGGTAAAETIETVAGTASAGVTVNIQVGIGTGANDAIATAINQGNTTALGVNGTTIATSAAADTASTNIDTAIANVNTARSGLGAGISRLQFAGNNIAVAVENLSAAQSILLDVDVSMEITEFTSQQVLIQAGVSMLAQANQQPSLLLRLLQ